MKKILTLLFFSSLAIHAFAQEKRVNSRLIPEKIKNYLQLNFPSVKGIEYFKKKDRDSLFYEVEFVQSKQEYNIRFSLEGSLVEIEREIEFDEIRASLQQIIKSALNENFAKVRIRKTQEVDPGAKKHFEVYVKTKKSNKFKAGFYRVMFDDSGKLLSIEEEKLSSIETVF